MAEQLMMEILETEEEEALIPVEIDPVLLMTDAQIKRSGATTTSSESLFEDVKKFAEDQEKESRECTPLDRLCPL